jgi:hypothetical protein
LPVCGQIDRVLPITIPAGKTAIINALSEWMTDFPTMPEEVLIALVKI